MTINYQWEDHGKTAKEWNEKFPRTMIDLYSEEGHGRYLESPYSSGKRYFIPAIPVLSSSRKVTKEMRYENEVEEVFEFHFKVPNSLSSSSSLLRIERVKNFLKPVPIVCGVSPTQIRMALNLVVEYLGDYYGS